MSVERSAVRFGGTEIAYRIRRSARRKTVAVSVAPDEGVVLCAPVEVPVSRLDRVVHDKARWIVDRMRRVAEVEDERAPVKEMVSGETFSYLGRHYRLKVEPVRAGADTAEGARPTVRLEGGWLRVRVAGEARAEAVRAGLEAWYRTRAQARIPERVALWSERAELAPGAVLIRAQARRWGSCDAAGNLRFNWRVMQAPMRLVDYVVAHEVVHLEHAEHTSAFWAALGALMPDYEARRERLRQMGPRLIW